MKLTAEATDIAVILRWRSGLSVGLLESDSESDGMAVQCDYSLAERGAVAAIPSKWSWKD